MARAPVALSPTKWICPASPELAGTARRSKPAATAETLAATYCNFVGRFWTLIIHLCLSHPLRLFGHNSIFISIEIFFFRRHLRLRQAPLGVTLFSLSCVLGEP